MLNHNHLNTCIFEAMSSFLYNLGKHKNKNISKNQHKIIRFLSTIDEQVNFNFWFNTKIHKAYQFVEPFLSYINPKKHKIKASKSNHSTSTRGPSSLNQWVLITEF
jgi:hypothetical protein